MICTAQHLEIFVELLFPSQLIKMAARLFQYHALLQFLAFTIELVYSCKISGGNNAVTISQQTPVCIVFNNNKLAAFDPTADQYTQINLEGCEFNFFLFHLVFIFVRWFFIIPLFLSTSICIICNLFFFFILSCFLFDFIFT